MVFPNDDGVRCPETIGGSKTDVHSSVSPSVATPSIQLRSLISYSIGHHLASCSRKHA